MMHIRNSFDIANYNLIGAFMNVCFLSALFLQTGSKLSCFLFAVQKVQYNTAEMGTAKR